MTVVKLGDSRNAIAMPRAISIPKIGRLHGKAFPKHTRCSTIDRNRRAKRNHNSRRNFLENMNNRGVPIVFEETTLVQITFPTTLRRIEASNGIPIAWCFLADVGPDFQEGQKHLKMLELIMLSWALTFLVLALVAALFGFGGIAAGAAGIAKILFFLFLVLFAVSLIANVTRGRSSI